jgi:diguanylate cyclase (GGDEF)-like protein
MPAALAAVRKLSFHALNAGDAEAVYSALAQELFRVFAVDDVHISRLDRNKTVAEATRYSPGPDDRALPKETYLQTLGAGSAALEVARSGQPLMEADARASTIMNAALTERFHVSSALFVPVTYNDDARAVVVLTSQVPREFSGDEIELVFTLVNQCSAALAALAMQTDLAGRADRQAALTRAASALNARLNLRAVLETLCCEADSMVGGDVAGVYLGDAEAGGVAVAGHGMASDSDWYGYVLGPGEGVGGQVLATGEPAVSNAYRTEVAGGARIPAMDTLQTAVAVPVRWDGELKGALSVGFGRMREITDEDLQGLRAMAELAAVACRNAEAFERAEAAARTDSLTGLLNHGALHVRLRDEIARVGRTGDPLTCLLVDLDNFKPINDRHGHLMGDQVLKLVADALREEFRDYDGIARFGGDEFVVVLPGVGADEAEPAARRLQQALAGAVQSHGLAAGVTSSVGVALWTEPLTAGDLVDRADRALLLAKRRGKNEVVLATRRTEGELARLEWNPGGRSELLAELWDMVSQCDRPQQVLARLPALLCRSLDLADCVLVHPALIGNGAKTLARLDGGAVTRSTLPALRQALAITEQLPIRDADGAHAAIGLQRDGDLHGLLVLRSDEDPFPLPLLRLAELTAAQALTALTGQTGGASRSAVGALAAAIDARDNYTHAHSEQVVTLAEDVAGRLGLDKHAVEQIRDGAMLHDVGKVAIPNEILYKPGPLTAEEWAVMREHPVIGERILLRTPELAAIAPMVRHEHERFDGNGYPDGLIGTGIPIGSRVILACDAYNAMITARPYRDPMSHEDACAELEAGAGTQFDPEVVAALLAALAAGRVLA